MDILDDVHLRIGLTHFFVYQSGCDFIPMTLFPLMRQTDDI